MGCDIHCFAEVRKYGNIIGERNAGEFEYDWVKIEEPSKENPKYNWEPFGWRSYGIFGFLADVRNYSCVPCIVEPRGLPNDSNYLNKAAEYNFWNGEGRVTIKSEVEEDPNYHTLSHIYLSELIAFDYEQTFEDRRFTKQVAPNVFYGGETCEVGEGNIITFRDFLGTHFFDEIERLKEYGEPKDVRIIFWFDN